MPTWSVMNRRTFARLSMAAVIVGAIVATAATQTVPPDALVTVNGVTLHYVEWGGKGDTLLFLTGAGASAREFDSLAQNFTDRFCVIGLTRRGQGQSEAPASGYDTDTLVEDIKHFLDAMKLSRVA